jgi:hypothetical protein
VGTEAGTHLTWNQSDTTGIGPGPWPPAGQSPQREGWPPRWPGSHFRTGSPLSDGRCLPARLNPQGPRGQSGQVLCGQVITCSRPASWDIIDCLGARCGREEEGSKEQAAPPLCTQQPHVTHRGDSRQVGVPCLCLPDGEQEKHPPSPQGGRDSWTGAEPGSRLFGFGCIPALCLGFLTLSGRDPPKEGVPGRGGSG